MSNIKRYCENILSLVIFCAIISGCTLSSQQLVDIEYTKQGEETPLNDVTLDDDVKIEITFRVEIPKEKQNQVYLDILDEVTGLALNSKRFPMEQIDDNHFEVSIPFKLGTVVKYRYSRDGNPIAIEHTASGSQVRYRFYYINSTGEVLDTVAAWNDVPYSGETGRIQGRLTDISKNPLPDILISTGGVNTITASDGSFLLEGLLPGTHNLVAYSLNGNYISFQQQALIAANATTPAILELPPTHNVSLTFVLTPPEDTVPGLPIRLVGNTYSLGNTFSNLEGGISVLASRAPYLNQLPDGRYSITLSLPAGLDLRYKYSLGDGFWNTEHKPDGSFRVRQIIVPDTDQIIEDHIESWQVGDFKPIMFQVTVPENTPKSDTVSIQFNPYAWTAPIPMWPTGENRWVYILNAPLHLLNNIQYRYCRNEQCGIAEPAGVVGSLDQLSFTTSNSPEIISDEILQWAWTHMEKEQTKIVGKDVVSRTSEFIAGVEMLDYYHPSWNHYFSIAYRNIKELGANWVFLSPTWHFTSLNPPVLEPVPGQDALWMDLHQLVIDGQRNNFSIALYPQSKFIELDEYSWWSNATRDAGWWQSWFDRYRTFLLNFADFAEQNKVDALVLGERNILPSLPSGILADGTPSNVFPDSEKRWLQLVSEVRNRYHGQLILAVDIDTIDRIPNVLLSESDMIYLTLSASITTDEPEPLILENAIGKLIDERISPVWESTQKPMIIGLKYPSAHGAEKGCIQVGTDCLPFEKFDQPMMTPVNGQLDLDIQLEIYEAMMSAINDRQWIGGIVSRGYFPPTELQDLSSSIHGKPSSAILWYWYPRFLAAQ